MSTKPIVVLTPVRNEAWCLQSFVECALAWADFIIFSDQGDDGFPLELARKYDNVIVISNENKEFNERENRARLIEEARHRFGRCIMVALDADERLTSNVIEPHILNHIRNLPEGHAIAIPFANLDSQLRYWEVPLDPICFSDDGRSPDNDKAIHFPRSGFSRFGMVLDLGIKALHLQYLSDARYASKLRWYQLLEITRLQNPNPVKLFRRYHHRDAVREHELRPLPEEWTKNYSKLELDPFLVHPEMEPWWNAEAESMANELQGYDRVLAEGLTASDRSSLAALRSIDRGVLSYLIATSKLYKPSRTSPIFLALYLLDFLASFAVSKFGKSVESRPGKTNSKQGQSAEDNRRQR